MIQMILFFCCIIALVFVIWNGRRRELNDISETNRRKLKREPIKITDKNTIKSIKKDRALVIFGVFMLIVFVVHMLEIWINSEKIQWTIGFIMTIVAVIWLVYDIVQVKSTKNKVELLAYVQSTFTNPRSKAKTVELIYYDYKNDKLKLKTVAVNEYETKNGRIHKKDLLHIVAEEGIMGVKYVCLVEKNI